MTARVPGAGRRRARAIAARAARGVSLIEMMIVVVLIAAITALAASAMSGGLKGSQLRASAKEISSQLRFTRTRAIATGQTQKFVVDPVKHAWTGAGSRHGTFSDALKITFTGAREVQPREGEGAILFFADGASTGGRVQLARDTAAWNIDVAWLTGEVHMTRGTVTP